MPRKSSDHVLAGEKEKTLFLRVIERRAQEFLGSITPEECDSKTRNDISIWTEDTKRELDRVFVEWYDAKIKGTKLSANIVIPAPRRDRIYRKFGKLFASGCCEVCGNDRVLNIAHIIPRADNGPDEAWNLMRLCANHHYLFDNSKLIQHEWNSIDWSSKDSRAVDYVAQHQLRNQRRFWKESG